MNPILLAQIRRNWVLVAAALVFLIFLLVHLTVFMPAARRYQDAVKRAADIGLTLDPAQSPPLMPARVFALLSDNSLPAHTADVQGGSGELAASFLDEITRLASKHGMEVAETEPGVTTQLPKAVQVRAHIRVQCSYSEFVDFLGDLHRTGRLISIDRFSLTGVDPGRHVLDLWLTRFVLKQSEDSH